MKKVIRNHKEGIQFSLIQKLNSFGFSTKINQYSNLVQLLKKINEQNSSNFKVELLSQHLKLIFIQHSENDKQVLIQNTLKLVCGQLEIPTLNVKFYISRNIILKAMEIYFEENFVQTATLHKDLGQLAFTKFKESKQRQSNEVDITTLTQIMQSLANIKGKHSSEMKAQKIAQIFELSNNEYDIMFLIRILEQNIRVGLKEKTVLKALDHIEQDIVIEKNLIKQIQQNVFGFQLTQKDIQVGIPLNSMLSKPLANLNEAIQFFGKFQNKNILCEFKYDGQRCQIHWKNNQLNIFSRNFENQQDKFYQLYQELINFFTNNNSIKSVIMDAEILAIDDCTGKILPFISLSQKKNKSANVKFLQMQAKSF